MPWSIQISYVKFYNKEGKSKLMFEKIAFMIHTQLYSQQLLIQKQEILTVIEGQEILRQWSFS